MLENQRVPFSIPDFGTPDSGVWSTLYHPLVQSVSTAVSPGAPLEKPDNTPRERLQHLVQALGQIAQARQARLAHIEPQIAFLTRYGVPDNLLLAAQERARRIGTSPERVIINLGLIAEESYLDLFADEFGFYRVSSATRILSTSALNEAIGLRFMPAMPVPGTTQARSNMIVPGPASLKFLMSGQSQPFRRCWHLASMREFESLVLLDAGLDLMEDVTHARLDRAGQVSASAGLSHGHIVVASAVALITTLFCLYAPQAGFIFLSLFAGLAFFAVISVRLMAAMNSTPVFHPAKRLSDADLPIYTIMVALYRETRVVSKLCKTLRSLDYPPEKLDIKFILEADDPETLWAIMSQQLPSRFSTLIVPDGQPRTKPRALNLGLAFAQGSFVTIYDAEDEPDPQQLRRAVERFAAADERLACLQASLVPDNAEDGLLQALFTLEYATLFDVIKNGLSNLSLPIPLGGTSNHFRKSVLDSVGGWDAFNVTEDAELGLRLARLGYRTERLQSDTFEEAPPTLKAWFNQRRRWSKGWLQTAIAHSTHPVEAIRRQGILRFLAGSMLMIGTILCMLAFPLGSFAFFRRCIGGTPFFSGGVMDIAMDLLTLSVAGLGSIALFYPSILALGRRGLSHHWPVLALIPVYLLGITLASWMAVLDLALKPFHWHKTEHGFARNSSRKGQALRSRHDQMLLDAAMRATQ